MRYIDKIPAGLQIIKAKISGKKIPVFLSWAATYRCNQRCRYCRMSDLSEPEMDTQQVKSMADKLYKLGTRVINITGGEALLRDDIFELIEYFKRKKIYVCLNTNGILVKDNIKKLRFVDQINFSLEGPEQVHDAIRGKGAYNAVIEAVGAVLNQGVKAGFTATLNKYNLDCLEHVLKLASERKIKVTFEILEHNMLGSTQANPLKIENEKVRCSIGQIIGYKRQAVFRNVITNSFTVLDYLKSWPELDPLDCASGNIVFRADPRGMMFSCAKASYEDTCRTKYSIDLVNNNTGQIKETLDSWVYGKQRDCSCACSSRHAASLFWNMRF